MSESAEERCSHCDQLTDNAGAADDSSYVCGFGPLCDDCLGLAENVEQQARRAAFKDAAEWCRREACDARIAGDNRVADAFYAAEAHFEEMAK